MFTQSKFVVVFLIITLTLVTALPNQRIVGGATAAPGQFPYQASLRFMGLYHICGGTIISNNWIVTVAHCSYGWPVAVLGASVGAHHIRNDGETYQLQNIVLHPEYENDGFFYLRNDIALVQTMQPMVYGATVSPLSIGIGEHVGAGISVRASGWGTLWLYGPEPQYLQFLDMITLTNIDCRSRHPHLSAMVSDGTICAYSTIGEGMCHGDYGGPLVANGMLVGIVSWSEPCGVGRPDAFTRISQYVPWITEIIS